MSAREPAVVRPEGYRETTVRKRIEAFFLDNLGRIATREQIQEAARDPGSGRIPENWHQRLSELRVDSGYSILSWRDRSDLRPGEYVMPTAEKRAKPAERVKPTPDVWRAVLGRAQNRCEWVDPDGVRCGNVEGAVDPIGGGKVRLSADHMAPHSGDPDADRFDPTHWQALCPRHQVVKKNFWNHLTGKFNLMAIIRAAPESDKREVYSFLQTYFGRGG